MVKQLGLGHSSVVEKLGFWVSMFCLGWQACASKQNMEHGVDRIMRQKTSQIPINFTGVVYCESESWNDRSVKSWSSEDGDYCSGSWVLNLSWSRMGADLALPFSHSWGLSFETSWLGELNVDGLSSFEGRG